MSNFSKFPSIECFGQALPEPVADYLYYKDFSIHRGGLRGRKADRRLRLNRALPGPSSVQEVGMDEEVVLLFVEPARGFCGYWTLFF